MSLKLSQLKKWLTLEDSAKYLSLTFNETIEAKDLIQLALEGELTLSVLFPDQTIAVRYEHNKSAHEPMEQLLQTDLLGRLQRQRRMSWALMVSAEMLYEPNFEECWNIEGVWEFPCTAGSGNIEILGSMLSSALSAPLELPASYLTNFTIIIRNPASNEMWGLVELSYDAFEDELPSTQASYDYRRREELPNRALIVLTQTEIQRFISSVNAAEQGTQSENTEHQEHSPANAILDNESEIKRLQRTVAALALGLAAKPGAYNKAGKTNVSQLAKLATEHLRDGQNDRTPHGFSETTVRNTIAAALKACPELKG
jgi:hypothetical protein